MQVINQEINDSDLVRASNQVLTALEQAVIAEKHGDKKPGATGISIYFPNSQLYRSPLAGDPSYSVVARRFAEALFGGDPAAFETALDALVASAEAAQKIAPTDVEARITKSVNGFKDLRTGLKKFNFDFEAAAADPEFAALLEDPDLEANGNEIDAYLSEKCGIAPG